MKPVFSSEGATSSQELGASDWRDTWFEPSSDWVGEDIQGAPRTGVKPSASFGFAASSKGEAPLSRLAQVYVWSRLGVALALIALLAALQSSGTPTSTSLWSVTAAYAVQAAWMIWQGRQLDNYAQFKPLTPLWSASTLVVDLLTFAALSLASASGNSFEVLMLMPVLMAGMLLGRLLGLATASVASLFLLAETTWGQLAGTPHAADYGRAGLMGLGFMFVAWLSVEMSQRLRAQVARTQFHQAQTEQQAQLNHLVMDEMSQGALVIDRWGRLRAANRSARAQLDLPDHAEPESGNSNPPPSWPLLKAAVDSAFAQGRWPEAGQSLVLVARGGAPWPVKVRIRFARTSATPGSVQLLPQKADLCVLFLEDERQLQAVLQQEKLAAMGRMSAGMAHEIRNPLAAISQAGALLSEEELARSQRVLLDIMVTNAARLQRLVSDVLDSVPGSTSEPLALPMPSTLASIAQEWASAAGVPDAAVHREGSLETVKVLFDPEHLRRVMVNLLDNAWRHSSQQAGAVRLSWDASQLPTWTLRVYNDGPAVDPAVQSRLFEPFFSTRARGSGLGLYLCRELCDRYGGELSFEPGAPQATYQVCFVLSLRCAPSGDAAREGR